MDFYDYLPDYSIFIHAFPEQWHNDLFGPFTVNTLRNIRLESVSAHGCVNLRCQHSLGCPVSAFSVSPSQADIDARPRYPRALLRCVPANLQSGCRGGARLNRERVLRTVRCEPSANPGPVKEGLIMRDS